MITYNTIPTKQISSTSLQLFKAKKFSIVDSIFVSNTTNQSMLLSIEFLRNEMPSTFLFSNLSVPANTTLELLKSSVLYLSPTNSLIGYSDYSTHYFDCHVSYRELLEEEFWDTKIKGLQAAVLFRYGNSRNASDVAQETPYISVSVHKLVDNLLITMQKSYA